VVSSVAVLVVNQTITDEPRGLAEHIRATGARPTALVLSYLLASLAGSLVILILTGVASGLAAESLIGGEDVFTAAVQGIVAQWPAVALVTVCAAVVTAIAPRASWLAWAPLALGGGLTLLGGLLKLPDRAVDLSMFGHTESGVALSTGAGPQLVILGLVVAGALVVVRSIGRRDLA
jgi:ABC-2 type transport system permease protein